MVFTQGALNASGIHPGSGGQLLATNANGVATWSNLTITTGAGLGGGGVVGLGNTITLTNTGVLSVSGTANQINVSGNTGSITISLPQDIAVNSSPTFANLTTTSNLIASGTVTYGTSITSSCAGLTGYIWVPGNSKFGTLPGFCVMKYEAKDDGSSNAVSVASGSPWSSITPRTAETTAAAACTGCHLITEPEWMTIATNVLWVNANWCSADGSGCGNAPGAGGKILASGNNDFSPSFAGIAASSNDAQACYGTVTADVNTVCGAVAGTQKRTLTLSNGSVIWDIAGNLSELTDSWVIGSEQPTDSTPGFGTREVTAITKWQGLQYANPTNRGWNSTQGLGTVYSDGTSSNNVLYAFLRGGCAYCTTDAGAFALQLFAPTSWGGDFYGGFRVAR